ncbi:MAG: beta-lactamase family protein, partial [Deinococcota bacterium]|nr:beta-lactamase family protein [Deinococcota bacterium]
MPGMPEFQRARERLHGYLDGGEVPGAVALAGTAAERALVAAAGVRELWRPAAEVPVRRDTLYDLASLTKVVATLPAVM